MKVNLFKKLSLVFYIFIVFLSFMDAAVYLSMRSIWFFINKTLSSISGANLPWAVLFFILFCASFIYSLVLFILYIKKQKGDFNHLKIKNIILPLILVLLFSAIDIFLYIMLGSSRSIVPANLLAALPWVVTFLIIVFFVVFYPDLEICHSKKFKYITAFILVFDILLYLMDFGGVKITSGPFIQLVDSSNLSITWTTDKKSTAYVEYGPDEKNLKRISASSNGVIDANTTVHKVTVPVGTQSEFVYRVGSTKINNYYQNSIEYGNTAISTFKKYSDFRLKDKITFYVLNDIHENGNIYKKFLSKDDFDFIVLNGDSVNSVDGEDTIIDKILKPVSFYTDGTKPFYFVRGNHETRGSSLRALPDFISLPQDNFYYTFNAGSIFAVVLDSGEDKLDSHEEYSGLADFNKYKDIETTWLQALSQSDAYKNAKYRIAFVHIPLNSFEGQAEASYLKVYEQKWRELLNNMKIDAVFSGHTHDPEMIKPDGEKFKFPVFIGGGDSTNENSYIAIRVEVTKESMKVYYINYDGSIKNEYEVKSNLQS